MARYENAEPFRTTVTTARSIEVSAGSVVLARKADRPDRITITQYDGREGHDGMLITISVPATEPAIERLVQALRQVLHDPVGVKAEEHEELPKGSGR